MDKLLAIRRQMFGAKTITFADPNVEALCATNWGNGTSITYAQAAKVTNLGNVFTGNTTITSFDELQYFTGLTQLPERAFSGCTNLITIALPSTVTFLGKNCFLNCSNITEFDISNISTIKDSCFMGCSSFSGNIILPELTILEASAFKGTAISKILNLGKITALNAFIFQDCTNLTEVTFPNTLLSVGNQTFSGASSLNLVNISCSALSLGTKSFYSCTALSTFPFEKISTIGQECFRYSGVVSINAPNLTSFSSTYAFANCSSLLSIVSLGNITTIQDNTFRSCSNLETVSLPNTLTTFGNGCFYGCSKITTITIPSTVITISQFAFQECTSLATVYYSGNSTFTIGARAFQKCPLTTFPTTSISSCSGDYNLHGNRLATIELSANFTSVGYGGFIRNGEAATNVIVRATVPPIINARVFWYDRGGGSFYKNTLLKIYVPYSSDHSILAAYKSGTNWSDYASYIFELDENGNIPT